MAKVNFYEPIKSVQGKICTHDDVIYKVFGPTGRQYTSKICNPFRGEPTAAQVAQKAKFKQTVERVLEIMRDIDMLEPYRTAWASHLKSGSVRYKTLRGYIFAQVMKSL